MPTCWKTERTARTARTRDLTAPDEALVVRAQAGDAERYRKDVHALGPWIRPPDDARESVSGGHAHQQVSRANAEREPESTLEISASPQRPQRGHQQRQREPGIEDHGPVERQATVGER